MTTKAARDSKKGISKRHELWVANIFDGKRSASSGASMTDKGDVRTQTHLIECKVTEGRIPTMVKQFEKIAQEAYEDNLDPMLCLRFFYPESKLANKNGWVDLTVMRSEDVAEYIAMVDWA